MKAIQIPFGYHPDPTGGTEVYVAALSHALEKRNDWDVMVAAPGIRSETYEHGGLRVRRFAVADKVESLAALYGSGDPNAAREFKTILEEERPDVVHLHAFTRGVSLDMARTAKIWGAAVVFTYHTATVTCVRGTMMRWGTTVCDGVMLEQRCTACSLQNHGLNRVTAFATANLPRALTRTFATSGRHGGIWTALAMRELVARRHTVTRAVLEEVDQVIAVCNWVGEVLIENGVPPEKLVLCRQGICLKETVGSRLASGVESKGVFTAQTPLRLVFFGRRDPVKGLHVVLQALLREPELPISLDVFAMAHDLDGIYEADLQRLALGRRVTFHKPLGADHVMETMNRYDAVVVPSQGLETGPLVVLEAFAAGVPVIGSRLGGIAELVRDEVDGLLVAPGQVNAWRAALIRICREEGLLTCLRRGIRPPRLMDDVAQEMSDLYHRVLEKKAPTVPLVARQ